MGIFCAKVTGFRPWQLVNILKHSIGLVLRWLITYCPLVGGNFEIKIIFNSLYTVSHSHVVEVTL